MVLLSVECELVLKNLVPCNLNRIARRRPNLLFLTAQVFFNFHSSGNFGELRLFKNMGADVRTNKLSTEWMNGSIVREI